MPQPSKLQELYDYLQACFVEFKNEPSNLAVLSGSGKTSGLLNTEQSYSYEYNVQIFALEFTQNPHVLFIAIHKWLVANQPDLYANEQIEEILSPEITILDNDTSNIEINFKLIDNVFVIETELGTEYKIIRPESVSLPGLDSPRLKQAVYIYSPNHAE